MKRQMKHILFFSGTGTGCCGVASTNLGSDAGNYNDNDGGDGLEGDCGGGGRGYGGGHEFAVGGAASFRGIVLRTFLKESLARLN